MKLKLIAGLVSAIGTTSVFAAAAVTCDTTTPVTTVNTCQAVTFYVAGSSALGSVISNVIPDVFDTTKPIIKVVDVSASGIASTNNTATSAWFGTSKAAVTGVAKYIYVVYNNNNGSAAGVSLLMGKLKTSGNPVEANIVKAGPISTSSKNTCVDSGSTSLSATLGSTTVTYAAIVNCSKTADTAADLAISDVRAEELYKLYSIASAAKFTDYKQNAIGLQGFGIAVNWTMYQALQTAQIANGMLPSTCTAGSVDAVCQPSIRKVDYATLISKDSGVAKTGKIFGLTDATVPLTLARRDDYSGTQAASNLFFANSCNATSKLGGSLEILGAVNSTSFVSSLSATSGGVKTALSATSGYAIGALGLGTKNGSIDNDIRITASKWNFVKIDGVSPNYVTTSTGLTQAYMARQQVALGNYPFAMTSYAIYSYALDKANNEKTGIAKALVAGLSDSTKHDLFGVAYLDGKTDNADTPKQSLVARKDGNNCNPAWIK